MDIKRKDTDHLLPSYAHTDSLLEDTKIIIDTARKNAYRAVNIVLVQRNWLLGKRISEEEFQQSNRAEYGKQIIRKLSDRLTELYGKGFDFSTLYKCVQFYKSFPDILDSSSPKSMLTWTHYRTLLQVSDPVARKWYEKEAIEQTWSVRTLQRNIMANELVEQRNEALQSIASMEFLPALVEDDYSVATYTNTWKKKKRMGCRCRSGN